jgi:hypothetical protein
MDSRAGQGRRLRRRNGSDRGLSRTRRAGFVAAATAYAAEDLRKADGLMRPALRRAALSLTRSSSTLLRRAGSAYLRLDSEPIDLIEPRGGDREDVLDAEAVEELPTEDEEMPQPPADGL